MTIPADWCATCELSPSDVETTASYAIQEIGRLNRLLRVRDASGRLAMRRLAVLRTVIEDARVESPRDRTRIYAHLEEVRASLERWSTSGRIRR